MMARRRHGLRTLAVSAGAAVAAGFMAYAALERAVRADYPALALARGRQLLRKSRRVLIATGIWDDAPLWIGGTMRLLAQQGADITVAGPAPVPCRPPWRDMADFRPLLPEDLPGDQVYSPAAQKALRSLWIELKPDLVFTFDPSFPVVLGHPARAVVGNAVIDLVLSGAVAAAGVYAFGTRRPDTLVDIGPLIRGKQRAMAPRPGTTGLRARLAPAAVGLLGRLYGKGAGLAYAEALRAVGPASRIPAQACATAGREPAWDGTAAGGSQRMAWEDS
ncbi:MAG: hypothetical protein H0Z37_05350 [Firmicutes bacterium]|nr:hypothetical protein [Bacillota bacterium]